MNLLKKAKESPKLSISIIISILLGLYELIASNAEILGINGKTLALLSFAISVVSYFWKRFNPEESLFTIAYKSIGGGGVKKPKDKKD